jgi:hypothetical protein
MSHTVPLRCRCGAVEGVVDLRGAEHATCYCDDCRAFARALGREDILDDAGGSAIVQVRPAHVRLVRGHEHVACLRLHDAGMLRFHTSCCQTPLGNVMAKPRLPFIGIPGGAVVVDDAALPAPMRVQGRFACGPVPPGTAQTVTPSQVLRTVRFLAKSALRGGGRPHSFFSADGAPIATPRVLSPVERDALRARDRAA